VLCFRNYGRSFSMQPIKLSAGDDKLKRTHMARMAGGACVKFKRTRKCPLASFCAIRSSVASGSDKEGWLAVFL
jgi:hypothetical protein